ncbi:hypothetical protein AAVH_29691 [Aphelenchoides avenae]|nr:hypothetical protein AAVH_29691 [Aphelenchus avenae]
MRRVTQVIGRELEQLDGNTELVRDGERRMRHNIKPGQFTLTYGETRHVFAQILYRYVDDAIYDA